MKKVSLSVLYSTIVVVFVISLSILGFAEDKDKKTDNLKTVKGDVVCLLPDYDKGTVTPVVAQGPCTGYPPHAHVLVSEDQKVYSLQGLDDGLQKIENLPNKRNVEIAGRVEGNTRGWILYVN